MVIRPLHSFGADVVGQRAGIETDILALGEHRHNGPGSQVNLPGADTCGIRVSAAIRFRI